VVFLERDLLTFRGLQGQGSYRLEPVAMHLISGEIIGIREAVLNLGDLGFVLDSLSYC